jgi:hypothetical protein
MAAFAPNGSYPEGPGYWSYGTTYNVLLIAALESVLGTDFGLSLAPGFSQTGEYLPLATGPSGQTFNYADGGAGRGVEPALFWLARRFARPDWLLQDNELLTSHSARLSAKDAAGGGDRFLPLLLLWLDHTSADAPVRMPLHWSSGGHVPISLHRSSWTDPQAVFVGLKGGSPKAPHGQMDTGSFVLDADGARWALDLGAEDYFGIESRGMKLWSSEPGSDRWTIFRQSNRGHNTLVIDGQSQQVGGNGTIVRFSTAPAWPHSVVDLSSLYAGQAKAVLRGVALLPLGASPDPRPPRRPGRRQQRALGYDHGRNADPWRRPDPRPCQGNGPPAPRGAPARGAALADLRDRQTAQRVGLAQSRNGDGRLHGRRPGVRCPRPGGPLYSRQPSGDSGAGRRRTDQGAPGVES